MFGQKTAKRCQGSYFGKATLLGRLVEGKLLRDERKRERTCQQVWFYLKDEYLQLTDVGKQNSIFIKLPVL